MSIKSIIKKLINNNILSEAELALMGEKEIRSVYKLHKEEIIMNKNTTEVIDNATVEEVDVKEESIMRTTQELLNDALTITKIQDEKYVTNEMLRNEYNKITGKVIGSKKTRPVIIKALQDAIAEDIHEEVPAAAEETVVPEAEVVSVGDLSITSDRVYYDDTIVEKQPVKPAPTDAQALTYKLMHKIGDYALNNRKKGFGTTISAWMLCAYILEVKYGIKKLKGHESEITDEMKTVVKDVRKWLIENNYIKSVTFKDENGFVFYTPEYDGNRQNSMYDITKFQTTGKLETTTYRITKEMNKWYK